MDFARGCCLRSAAEELAQATTGRLERAGERYDFREVCPLRAAKAEGKAGGGPDGLAELLDWRGRRLAEAAAMARKGAWDQWSGRTACKLHELMAATGAPAGHLLLVFPEPWFFGEAYLSDAEGHCREVAGRVQKGGSSSLAAEAQRSCGQGCQGCFPVHLWG